jgi:membrane protease YdiL (CAAX protease family)
MNGGSFPASEFEGPPELARPAPYPFWTYQDLLIFLALAPPSILAGGMLVRVIILIGGWKPPRAVELLPAQFLGYLFWFCCLYLLLRVKYDQPFWPSLRWVIPARGGLWAAFLWGPAVAFSVAFLGATLRAPEIEMPFKEFLSDPTSILLVAIFATTLGPMCEELAFRGFLFPLLERSLGTLAAIVVSALPFALLHGPQYAWSWQHILLVSLAGASFGWMRYRTGSTLAAAVMHATYNLTFFFGYLFLGRELPRT